MKGSDELAVAVLGAEGRRRSDAPFGLVEVRGADAVEFVHRLCSQDLRAMAPGTIAPLAFLDAKGKLVATGLALRDADGLWVETSADQVEGLAGLLDRYHFTEKLEIRRVPGECAEWRGPAGTTVADGWEAVGGGIVIRETRAGFCSVRAHGGGSVPDAPLLDEADAERLRILEGRVRVGVDTEKTTLGPEANLDDAIVVSESKGCYTGQEIVARIRTYGHINRRLCLVLVPDAKASFDVDTTLFEIEEGAPVGRTKSSVVCEGGVAALAYLPRELWEAGTRLRVGAADGPEAIVEPFAGSR